MRVLLSGYYGFGNLGDEAILAGLGGALAARGHTPVVLSGDPAGTERLHSFEARHRTWGLPAALVSADAVVSGGGGLLQDATSGRSLSYYLSVLRLARLAGRRTAVYGQSLGPLSARGRDRLGRALRGLPLFLRDRPSLALAADLGLAAQLVGDAALLLGPPGSSAAAPARSSERDRSEEPAGPILLIPRGGFDAYNDALVLLAQQLTALDRPLALMTLHPAEDLAPAARISEAAAGVEQWDAATPWQALEQISAAQLVVSARLHGCILAAVAGTPFVGLSYDPKVSGFLVQAGATSFEAPLDARALLEGVLAPAPFAAAAVDGLIERASVGIDSLLASLGG